MDRLNFLHKEIVLPEYDRIREEFKNYYYEHAVTGNLINQFFNPVTKDHCIERVPTFMRWVESQNLVVRGTTFIRALPHFSEGIHIDSVTEHYNPYDNLVTVALNIPITDNCPDSHTIWYRRISGVARNSNIENNIGLNIPYLNYSADTEYEEIERISLKTSTLLNIRIYHNVVNPTDTERVAASIRFMTDPWWLIE